MTTQVLLTSGTSWTVPSDCISATVECIGGGQGGDTDTGGTGADYAKENSISLTPGASITIAIGAGGTGTTTSTHNAGGDTWFDSTSTVLAKGGGSAATSVGNTVYAGGTTTTGGGGGAAGPGGAGGNASGSTGGAGDAGSGGAGGASGNDGAAGAEWGTAGSGGGGGAYAAGSSAPTIVHTAAQQNNSWPTLSVPSGATIIAFVGAFYAQSSEPVAPEISDNQSNTYTVVKDVWSGASSGNTTLRVVAYVCSNPVAASTTFSVSNGGGYPVMAVAVVTGANSTTPVDVSGDSITLNTLTPPLDGGSVSTTGASELLLSAVVIDADSGWQPTVGSGYTLDQSIDAANASAIGLQHATAASSGSHSATWGVSNTTPTSRIAVGILVALKS